MGIIYGLFDPRNDELGYIGKTEFTLKRRLQGHLSVSSLKHRTHKNHWINKLLREGLKPVIRIIQTVLPEELNDAEIYWVAYFRAVGVNLRNATDGGDGIRKGYVFSDEVRAKNAERRRCCGYRHSAQTRAKMRTSSKKQPVVDDLGNEYPSLAAAAKAIGARKQDISNMLYGYQKTVRGRVFRWAKGRRKAPSVVVVLP